MARTVRAVSRVEVTPRRGWSLSCGGVMPTGRTRLALVVYLLVVATGAVLALFALRGAAGFLASAPEDFWVLAGFALIADIRPFPLPATSRRSSVFVVSLCFCFAIMLLW